MNHSYFQTILLLLILCGCSAEEPLVLPDEPSQEDSDYVYLDFNRWVYQQMNHDYLWREDLPDSLDCDFSLSPKAFFESILSDKDRFSHLDFNSTRSDNNLNDFNMGFAFQEYYDAYDDIYYEVLYVKAENAILAGLRRGDLVKLKGRQGNFIFLDKISFNDGVITKKEPICFSLPNQGAINNTVQVDSVYFIDNKKIGYLCYLEFGNSSDLCESLRKFKNNNIDELVLDLRYNPGGLVSTCQTLCNCIVSEKAYGEIFQQSSYNDIIAHDNFARYGYERTFLYYDHPRVNSGPMLGTKFEYLSLDRVFVITSKNTASASESTINSLSPYMDVILIGENTVGKGVGMYTISSPEFKYSIVPITFRFYNALGETIPDNGLTPDYYLNDANLTHKKDLGDLSEPFLAKAIELITSSGGSDLQQEHEDSPIGNGLSAMGEPSFVREFNQRKLYEFKHYEQ